MAKSHRRRGSRWQQFFIMTLSAMLMVLFIWLLAFVDGDIGDWPGPDLDEIRAAHVDRSLEARRDDLQHDKTQLARQISEHQALQNIQRQSMVESRDVMNQMIEIHRLNLEKSVTPSPAEQDALAQSQTLYLTRQQEFQQANDQITRLNQQQRAVENELRTVGAQLTQQGAPAHEEYQRQRQRHRLKVASAKLLFIVPVLLIAAWLAMRSKKSVYAPITYAILIAAFWRVCVVMHTYFPPDYFKYIAVAAGIVVVLLFLIMLIRMVFRPKPDVLLKQYREAYHQHRCPVCAYPIQRGPLRYVVWNAKGPRGPLPPLKEGASDEDKPYTCPACGERLYDICGKCKSIRHALLPYCESCGQEEPALEHTVTGG